MFHLRFIPIVVGALAIAATGLAAQQAPIPKEFATFKCLYNWCADTPRTSPNGRFVVQGGPTALRMFDLVTKQSWVVSDGEAESVSWSARGDMIAFGRDNPDGDTYVWSMPIDPNTGKARGPAQRVSTGPGSAASISPDSRWIVFEASDSTTVNIVIVPSTGGPVRIIAPGVGATEASWSADGKTIYAVEWHNGSKGDVSRIRVADGKQEVIYKGGGTIAGMSADRHYLVLVPVIYSKEMAAVGEQGTVIDTTGHVVGHFLLPTGEKQFDRVLGDTAIVWLTTTDRRMLEVRPIAGGAAKRLPLIGESNDVARWSPDGKQISFQVRDANRRTVVAVSNADGSNPRVFPGSVTYGGSWSPDSRSLAVVNLDEHRLSVLDLATGALRTVLKDTAIVGGNFRWREDGKSFVIVKGLVGRTTFYQLSLNGQLTKLVELERTRASGNYIGSSEWFMRSDSVALIQPLTGGPARPLAAVPAGTRVGAPSVSQDMHWIASPLFVPKRTGNSQLELFATATGARTVLDLPFTLTGNVSFSQTDNSLFAIGRTGAASALDVSGSRADTVQKIYRVPLGGGRSSVVAEVGMMQRWQGTPISVIVSPDGNRLLYTVQPEASTQSLGLISLRGAIPAATARPPQD